MVDAIYRGAARPRNQQRRQSLIADPSRRRACEDWTPTHPDIIEHPLLSPDDQLRLVAAAEDEGRIALGDLVGAIPDHPAPISAVMVLVDAGLLAIDTDAAFDAAVQLWRPALPLR